MVALVPVAMTNGGGHAAPLEAARTGRQRTVRAVGVGGRTQRRLTARCPIGSGNAHSVYVADVAISMLDGPRREQQAAVLKGPATLHLVTHDVEARVAGTPGLPPRGLTTFGRAGFHVYGTARAARRSSAARAPGSLSGSGFTRVGGAIPFVHTVEMLSRACATHGTSTAPAVMSV